MWFNIHIYAERKLQSQSIKKFLTLIGWKGLNSVWYFYSYVFLGIRSLDYKFVKKIIKMRHFQDIYIYIFIWYFILFCFALIKCIFVISKLGLIKPSQKNTNKLPLFSNKLHIIIILWTFKKHHLCLIMENKLFN